LAIIISNASFFTPFSTIIIPDRNTLFLMIAFLYCFIYFFKTEKTIYLLVAFLCANTALYFKEPIFIYLVSFAFTSFCFHLYQKQFRLIDIFFPLALIRKQPIEILLPIISLCFVSLWAIFAFIVHPESETYDVSDVAYITYIISQLQNYPLFALIILMVIGYSIDYKNIEKHQFSLMLFIGGLFYTLAVSFLTSNLLYYYCIGELSILLAACYYLNNITWQKNLKWQLFGVFIAGFIVFDTIKSAQNLFADIQEYRITQHQIHAFTNNLPLDGSKTNKVFSYTDKNSTNEYSVSLHFLMLKNLHPTPAVRLHAFQPCYPSFLEKQTVQSKCIQIDKETSEWHPDDYDFTIFWGKQGGSDVWQSLYAQYGDEMQKITNFPSYLGDTERYNIYILQQ
ncbi:MAG: hypothetical protein K0U39_02125, partial [Alphaproteobacteria bacterium]|nr:hypothetical protein [Alphaproteobacteria bacterium]